MDGTGFMVNTFVIWQLVVLSVKVIVVGPVPMPVTSPEPELMDAFPGLLLLHVPSASASVNVVVDPVQTFDDPFITGGSALTLMVTGAEDPQPVM